MAARTKISFQVEDIPLGNFALLSGRFARLTLSMLSSTASEQMLLFLKEVVQNPMVTFFLLI